MSIATELTRIQTAKADIKSAIEAKGVTVPSSALIDEYDTYIAQISGGGGGQAEEDLKNLIERDITSINIPSGTTTIGDYVFCECTSLTSLTIPSGVTSIGNYAFSGCSNLTNITIPNSVTSIGERAFNSCRHLTRVNSNINGECIIPNSVTTIGNYAFNYCSSLTSVTIPSSVTSIDGNVFRDCSGLATVTIPSSVTSIGIQAFSGCYSLTSITVEATTPPTLNNVNAFANTNDCPIYVPAESVNTYKTTSNWSTYADRIQAIS